MPELLPEWHPQWGVMIAWPHASITGTASLPTLETTYVQLAKAILAQQHLLILHQDEAHQAHIEQLLNTHGLPLSLVQWQAAPYADMWVRHYGPLTVKHPQHMELHQFATRHGDAASAHLQLGSHEPTRHGLRFNAGDISSDGRRNVLTAAQGQPQAEVEAMLREHLKARRIWWIHEGHLLGASPYQIHDVARFCNAYTLAYLQCNDPEDEHYPLLKALEKELFTLASSEGFDLLPLPLPTPQYSSQGERLPASYTRFALINQTVLVPTFQSPTDASALEQLASAMPEYRIVAIDSRSLLAHKGSPHAATLQLPKGVI